MLFHFHDSPYIAIIGDIKSSKGIDNRSEVQRKLNRALEGVNERFSSSIASKFTVTLGDEFQGLLSDGSSVMMIISEIERGMHPLKIRFGIGIGRITTDIDRERAIGADGPGYHMARSAISFLKDNEKKKQAAATDMRLEAEGDHLTEVELINTVFSLMTAIKRSWSDRQREIIWDILEHRDNQSDVAERQGIQQPSVHKNLSRGYYYTYKNALNIVGKVLGEVKGYDA
ncbi:MAG: hypothetical protein JW780_02705 [Clostridiales bacterium]|nr:hypothetical protein [Clostridiales bacterium]